MLLELGMNYKYPRLVRRPGGEVSLCWKKRLTRLKDHFYWGAKLSASHLDQVQSLTAEFTRFDYELMVAPGIVAIRGLDQSSQCIPYLNLYIRRFRQVEVQMGAFVKWVRAQRIEPYLPEGLVNSLVQVVLVDGADTQGFPFFRISGLLQHAVARPDPFPDRCGLGLHPELQAEQDFIRIELQTVRIACRIVPQGRNHAIGYFVRIEERLI